MPITSHFWCIWLPYCVSGNDPLNAPATSCFTVGFTLLMTGIGLVAIQYPVINYWKVIPKSLLLISIASLTAAHRAKIVAKQTWQLLISLTVLTALIALWRTV